MKLRFSLRRVIIDLLYIKEQVYNRFKDDSRFKVLLNYLMKEDYLNDDSITLPTFKEMELQTGLKTYDLRKQLKEMYLLLFGYDTDFKFDFSEIEIQFTLEHYKNYVSFKCHRLPYLPRIGENIRIPFIEIGRAHV